MIFFHFVVFSFIFPRRVKSINNPDQRVSILKDYVLANFPATPLLLYALEVEKITTSKKPNLILNVDGCIATCFVDMLRNCGSFTSEEAQEYINIGAINSLFVLGRNMSVLLYYISSLFDTDFHLQVGLLALSAILWIRRDWSKVSTDTHGMTFPTSYLNSTITNCPKPSSFFLFRQAFY